MENKGKVSTLESKVGQDRDNGMVRRGRAGLKWAGPISQGVRRTLQVTGTMWEALRQGSVQGRVWLEPRAWGNKLCKKTSKKIGIRSRRA